MTWHSSVLVEGGPLDGQIVRVHDAADTMDSPYTISFKPGFRVGRHEAVPYRSTFYATARYGFIGGVRSTIHFLGFSAP